MTRNEIITCVALVTGAVAIGTVIGWLLPWPDGVFTTVAVAVGYYFLAKWILRRIERD